MKKAIALILAILMVLSLAVTAFAADDPLPANGTITVKGVAVEKDGDTYKAVAQYAAYRILDIASYDNTDPEGKISYKVNETWKDFFKNDTVAKQYFAVADNGYITFNDGSEDETALAKKIAAAAKAYADTNGITPDANTYSVVSGTVNTEAMTGNIKFVSLQMGYYLISSDMGVLCGVDSTAPDAVINAKNTPPTLTKKVEEDSLAGSGTSSWGPSNTADIGQVVKFDTTVDVSLGPKNYVVHDTMSEGLTFLPDTVSVTRLNGEAGNTREDLFVGTDYNVVTTGTCGCTFEVVFTESLLKRINANDQLVVLYSARLNEKALIGAANINEAYVSYGNNFETEVQKTETYTYSFDLVKIDGNTKELLGGAEFTLSYSADGTKPIKLVLVNGEHASNPNYIPVYHVWNEGDSTDGKTTTTTIVAPNGGALIKGLDKATYYLVETKAPQGYNKLATPHKVIIENTNLIARDEHGNLLPEFGTGVVVENKAGNELPETGAAGTMLFITFGMFVVLGTGVLLVTKKRMSMIVE